MVELYKVSGLMYGNREAAINAAITLWGTAYGAQELDPASWTDEEIKNLVGWCKVVGGDEFAQADLDEEVIAYAKAKRDMYPILLNK